MRYSDVETFLCIVRQKNLSKAANELFLAQSTVSQRLRKLENEFGGPLISRKQGVNEIVLTPKGMQFLEVANQMLSLWQQAEKMSKHVTFSPLSIGAVESVASAFFPVLLKSIVAAEPNIQLSAFTSHSMDLYNKVDNRELDYAFVVHNLDMPNIQVRHFAEEKMMLICSKNFLPENRIVEISDLDVHSEIFDSWSPAFREWHNGIWGANAKPFVFIDGMQLYMEMGEAISGWSICPVSIANYVSQRCSIDVHELSFEPPMRNLYLINRRNPLADREEGMAVFERCYKTIHKQFLLSNGLTPELQHA